MLTFPAGGGPGTTPVRIHVTDQDGLSGSRDFMLGGAVNLCTFMTMDGATTLSCNGALHFRCRLWEVGSRSWPRI